MAIRRRKRVLLTNGNGGSRKREKNERLPDRKEKGLYVGSKRGRKTSYFQGGKNETSNEARFGRKDSRTMARE